MKTGNDKTKFLKHSFAMGNQVEKKHFCHNKAVSLYTHSAQIYLFSKRPSFEQSLANISRQTEKSNHTESTEVIKPMLIEEERIYVHKSYPKISAKEVILNNFKLAFHVD